MFNGENTFLFLKKISPAVLFKTTFIFQGLRTFYKNGMLSVFVKSTGNKSTGQHMYCVYLITVTVKEIVVMVFLQSSTC